MYTYKLGGMLITDELYHDDLEAMTFGRKDQNELMHYGIKGQSWGKRRFQNEDGSLTMAGRNRYDVGDSRQGVSAFADTGSRGGSGVNYNRLPGGTGGSTRSATANQAPARLVGSNPRGRATTSATTTQKVANTTNAGRKAADNLFGRIGNWASNTAKDVGKAATNAYNDVSKAAGDAVNWVSDRAQDVGNLLSNQDEKQKMQDIIDKHYDPETNTFDSRENFEKYDNARTEYLNHPMTAVSEAGKWIGDRAKDVGNVASNIWDDASATARGVADSVGNRLTGNIDRNTAEALRRTADFQEDPNAPFHSPMEQYTPENLRRQADEYQKRADNSLFSRIGNAAKDVGNSATNAYNDASKWAGNAAQDVSDWFTGNKAGREAQRYDNVVQNFERNGERNINEGIDKISDSIDKNIDRIDIDLHGDKGDSSAHYAKNRDDLHDASNKQFWEGLNQRNMGYRQDDIAREYGQKADEAQARYDAAPRQLLNAAGNWIGDRVSDAGNAVGNVLKPGINAVGNAVRDAGNWVGDTAKNIYDDADYRLYSLGQDIAEPAKNRAWQDFQNRIAQDREIYNREFPSGDYQTWKSASDRIDDAFKDYQRESNKIEQNPISSAINNVGRSIGEGAQKAGDWASNAASDVRDWGAGAIDKGRQAFESLFGRSEPPKAELSDPNPKIITENIIPEQMIYEQTIPEQLIKEELIREKRR